MLYALALNYFCTKVDIFVRIHIIISYFYSNRQKYYIFITDKYCLFSFVFCTFARSLIRNNRNGDAVLHSQTTVTMKKRISNH